MEECLLYLDSMCNSLVSLHEILILVTIQEFIVPSIIHLNQGETWIKIPKECI
jgi:hypothetical protein